MIKKIKIIALVISFGIFTFLTINYYFSEENIIYINKSRSSYSLTSFGSLPILKNDTDNIVIYKDDIEKFKKKRIRRFWEKLISND